MPRLVDTVLFDLDGTLADTAADMGRAINTLRVQEGHAPLSMETIRPWVSHGSPGLLGIAFDLEPGHAAYPEMRQRFLDLYVAGIADETTLFAGMDEVLDFIESSGMRWGIVTNKPGWLTEPLLQELQLQHRAACVVSGDTTANRKPHPEPLQLAMKLVPTTADRCIYVGDADRDIAAGRAAGCYTVLAEYGYIGPHDDLSSWGADLHIPSPQQLLAWLNRQTLAAHREHANEY